MKKRSKLLLSILSMNLMVNLSSTILNGHAENPPAPADTSEGGTPTDTETPADSVDVSTDPGDGTTEPGTGTTDPGTGTTVEETTSPGGDANTELPDGVEYFEDGSYKLPDGRIFHPDNSIEYPDGTIVYPDGSEKHPDGVIKYPDGSEKYPDGTVKEADGTQIAPNGVIYHPNGTIEHPDGKIEYKDGTVKTADGTIIYPDGRKKLPDGSVVDKNGNPIKPDIQISPTINIPSPYVPVQDYISRPRTAPISITNPVSSTEPTEEVEEIDLSKVLKQLFANPSMVSAFDDFQYIIENFEFNDEVSLELTGTPLEEVIQKFQPDAEENIIDEENRTIIEYLYGEDEYQVKLSLYFTAETLTAVAIEDLNPNFSDTLSSGQQQILAGEKLTYSEVVSMYPNVIGLVHKKFNNEGYEALIIPSGTDENLNIDFVEVHPLYVISEESFDLEPQSEGIAEIIAEYVKIKQKSSELDVAENPIDDLSFTDRILANRDYQEEDMLSIVDIEKQSKQIFDQLLEEGKVEFNQIIEIMGEATETADAGSSRDEYYYAKDDKQVIIVHHQYNAEDNVLMQYSFDRYVEKNPAFPITVDELIALVSEPFDLSTLEEVLGEPNSLVYSPGHNQLQYTWSSSEDEEMVSIGAVVDLVTGQIGVFYNPVEE